ncbi:hypothetical protein [Sulfurimicrobium lacus]|uniref:hypothetical protein n=1 Tax=Sulfurimicrobium lacus TaxID=2715678 RepID=UPI001564B255|nr:hypothetical protein [Sulfurimicrobium lacus]
MAKRGLFLAGVWLVLQVWLGVACAAPASALTLSTGTEVSLRTFPSQGDTLLLWFVCDEGHGANEARTAQELASRGYETWFPDMLEAHFLPSLPSSLKQLPPEEITEMIAHAVKQSGKKVVLVTSGHGAGPILKGARAWQEQAPEETRNALSGAILFNPDLYSVPPAPGVEAQYDPVVLQTALPLFIFQGQLSPGRWWLEHLKVQFARGGAKVSSMVLPKVRGHFYVRSDATDDERAMTQRLPELIQDALQQLQQPITSQPHQNETKP